MHMFCLRAYFAGQFDNRCLFEMRIPYRHLSRNATSCDTVLKADAIFKLADSTYIEKARSLLEPAPLCQLLVSSTAGDTS